MKLRNRVLFSVIVVNLVLWVCKFYIVIKSAVAFVVVFCKVHFCLIFPNLSSKSVVLKLRIAVSCPLRASLAGDLPGRLRALGQQPLTAPTRAPREPASGGPHQRLSAGPGGQKWL